MINVEPNVHTYKQTNIRAKIENPTVGRPLLGPAKICNFLDTLSLSIMLHTYSYESTDLLMLSRAAWLLLEHGGDIGLSARKG